MQGTGLECGDIYRTCKWCLQVTYVVAVDLGGTKTIVSLLESSLIQTSRIVKKLRRPTHQEKGKKFVISNIIKDIDVMLQGINKEKIIGIGIAAPSAVDTKNGSVLFPPNLKGWKNVPLKDIIQRKFKMPVTLENDSNLAALGEYTQFRTQTLFCLMLGTGVGGGLVIDGKIYNGINSAIEIGHMIIDSNSATKCSCGNFGCLESFVSGRSIAKKYKELKKTKREFSAKDVAQLAKKGDKKAKQVLRQASYHLSLGLINIINIFEPEVLVLSGGISNIKKDLILPAIKLAKKQSLVPYKGKIVHSQFFGDSILLGADYLMRHEYFLKPFRKEYKI